jgi:carboxylate-amine ligase
MDLESSSANVSFGIEEEFFLVDRASRDLVACVPPDFMRRCRRELGNRVAEEMLRPQIEVATPILHDSKSARTAVTELRRALSDLAAEHDMMLVASGTHPLAEWQHHLPTDKPRYARLVEDFQIVGRRNLFCGLHVHAGIPQGVDRVQLMNRLVPCVPILLALSTSSPFWAGRTTGLLSYRQAAYDEWPRSGIPDSFSSEAEYSAFIRLLASCGALEDGSHLWWSIRPSATFPTLELRIADACTHVEDALAVAAAFRCLVRAHLRDASLGRERSAISRRVVDENRWRAKRYGTEAEFIDEKSRGARGFTESLDDLIALVTVDAAELGCPEEIAHLRRIVRRGSSAHTQLLIYRAERALWRTPAEALARVVDWLAETTVPAKPERHGHYSAPAMATA